MTNEELRIAIAKAKGYEIGYAYELFAEVRLGDPVPEPEKSLMYLYHEKTFSDGSPIWVRLPDYPNDIAAAWELVEEMYAMGFTVNIQRDYTGNTVYLTERGIGLYRGHIVEHADIAATAICESYLKLLAWKEMQE